MKIEQLAQMLDQSDQEEMDMMAETIVEAIRDATTPLLKRIQELETRVAAMQGDRR